MQPRPEPAPWTTLRQPDSDPSTRPQPDTGPTEGQSAAATWWSTHSPSARPAAWLSIVGAVLVLAAAVAASAARWEQVPVPARLAGLLAIHGVIVAISERGRRWVPSVARVLAHLGAALAIPSVVSATATLHGSWRTCTLFGGLAGLAALEMQGRRWKAGAMHGAEVAAVAVAAAGAAALTQRPIGVLIAVAAAVALLFRCDRRAAALAGVAAAAPVLALLARARIGAGTIAEFGATGGALRWGAPLAGLLCAAVFVRVATTRRESILLWPAAMAAVSGVWIGYGRMDLSPIAWACLPGLVLITAELLGANRSLGAHARAAVSEALEVLEVCAVFFALLVLAFDEPVPLLLLSIGWAMGAVRPRSAKQTTNPCGVFSAVALVAALNSVTHSGAVWSWLGFGAVAAYAYVTGRRGPALLAGVIFPAALGFQLDSFDVRQSLLATSFLVGGIAVLGGASVLRRSVTGFDAAGCSAMVIGAAALQPDRLRSWTFIAVGLVMIAVGVLKRHIALGVWGSLVAATGAFGTVVASSLDGVAKVDLVVAGTVAGLIVLEAFFRRRGEWEGPAYFSSSVIGSVYAVVSLLAIGTDGRLIATLALGIAALAVGATTSRSTVAVSGAAVTGSALVFAGWDQLSALPVWVWVMAGGVALIAAALLVERLRARHE